MDAVFATEPECRLKSLIAALVIIAVAVAGISALIGSDAFASGPPSSDAVSATTTTFTQFTNTTQSFCGSLVKTVSFEGYAIKTYLSSTSTRRGDVLCVNVVLLDEGGRNLTIRTDGGVGISYNITERDGAVVFKNNCTQAAPPSSSSNETDSTYVILAWSCSGFWDTGLAYNGVLPQPGTYDIAVNAAVPNKLVQGLTVVGSTVTMKLLG